MIVLVFLLVVGCQGFTEEQMARLKVVHDVCAKETNINEEIPINALAGEFPEDPIFKQYLFCFGKQTGLQKESGEINFDTLKSKLELVIDDPAKIEAIITKCAVEKGTPEDTAFEFVKCSHPIKYS